MTDKILIVDDEPEIADLVSLYLQNENFTVFKFYNAADALKCVQSETLDLAILDVMLPDMNGFQLCKKIREIILPQNAQNTDSAGTCGQLLCILTVY